VVIIDESSMIDVFLMSSLVRAIPPEATLILVGDIDQLPSVGPGNILRDLIGSGKIPVSFLRHIYRQGEDSSIVLNSHLINRGKMPSLKTTRDFRFIREEDPERILKYIVSMSRQNANRVQVLSPMHRGIIGVKNLNVVLQDAINPHGRPFAMGKRRFRTGDRVIQTVNDYEKDVFNGDMGVIASYDEDEKTVYVDYDGRPVRYQGIEFNDVELAFAVSIHKAQGSEYPMVVMPVSTQHYVMLQRNLIYTGLTRAKEEAVLIGSVKALGVAVRNDGVRKRYSGLKERLTGGIEKWRASTELF
jgi:exodeoxyribonuclease V alpha subunit